MGTLANIASEIAHARRLTADRRSLVRWSTDIIAYRLLRVWRPKGRARLRTITLADDTKLTYRCTRGDLLSLREVWMDEVYRLPAGGSPRSLIDLGANIGLASVWFARTYRCKLIVAVEPVPANVRLMRRNLRQNGIAATVLECAVGPAASEARFTPSQEPNSGRLARDGKLTVAVCSMDVVLAALGAPDCSADVVKIDIEGAEEALLGGDPGWLASVGIVVAELHPELVDSDGIVAALEHAGLRALPVRAGNGAVTTFVRKEASRPGSPARSGRRERKARG